MSSSTFGVLSILIWSLASSYCNETKLMRFLSNIEDNYQFHSVVFVVPNSSSLDLFTLNMLKTPLMFLMDEQKTPFIQICSWDNLYIVLMEKGKLLSVEIMRKYAKDITRYGKVLVLNPGIELEVDDRREIFEWFWNRRIMQVIIVEWLACGAISVFTYNPFPEISEVRVADLERPFRKDFFNLKGYPIRSFAVDDLPRALKYTNRKGEARFAGYSAKLLLAFIEKHNGTFVEFEYNGVNYVNGFVTNDLLMRNLIDIAMHPYARINLNLSYSYPLDAIEICVLVPAAKEVYPALYNVLTFEKSAWLSLLIAVLYLTAVHVLVKLVLKYKIDCLTTFIESIQIVITLIPDTKLYTVSWQCRIIFILCGFFGMIVTSLYQTTLTSMYTTKVYGKQIDTVEDLIEANVTILTLETEWTGLSEYVANKNFSKQFRPININLFHKLRDSFDSSHGYTVPTDRSVFILEQQSYLPRPIFTPPKFCIIRVALQLTMQYYNPFEEILDRTILQCREAGLLEKWLKDAFDVGVEVGKMKRIAVSDGKYKQLVLTYFEYIWILWFAGIVLAAIVFLMEIVIITVWNK